MENGMENQNTDEMVFITIPVSEDFLPLANRQYEMISTPEKIASELSDDAFLKNLLQEFQMESVFVFLKDSKVTFKILQYMKKEDIQEAIPPLGLRMEFREKLFARKKKEFGIDEETLSMPSKVGEWLKNCKDTFSTPSSSVNSGVNKKISDKGLVSLLAESFIGNDILEFYKLHKNLTSDKRDEIIRIIIEEVIKKDLTLRAQDFSIILTEICEVFPTESEVKEYYYIPRMGKKNPSGKLFSKYRNKRSKKARLTSASLNSVDASSSRLEEEDSKTRSTNQTQSSEIDESVAASYKLSLSRDSADWEGVCHKWKLTYSLRQKDLKKMGSLEFLREGSKLSHSRASELIDIDFQAMYPDKDQLLFSKWEAFKKKIGLFYEKNIHNDFCKQLFCNAKSSTNQDAQDYIFIILLNAISPSSARFENNSGKRRIKVTIVDAQESLVLRVQTINDYKRQIDAVVDKYYSAGTTVFNC